MTDLELLTLANRTGCGLADTQDQAEADALVLHDAGFRFFLCSSAACAKLRVRSPDAGGVAFCSDHGVMLELEQPRHLVRAAKHMVAWHKTLGDLRVRLAARPDRDRPASLRHGPQV